MMNSPSQVELQRLGFSHCIGSLQSTGALQQQLVDIDGDGDLDKFTLVSTGKIATILNLFNNEGTDDKPVYVKKDLDELGLVGLGAGVVWGFRFIDIDLDGDFDFLDSSESLVYINEGSAENPKFIKSNASPVANLQCQKEGESYSRIGLPVDLNNDGKVDKLCMNGSGQLEYFELGESGYLPMQDLNKERFLGEITGFQSFDIDKDGDMDMLSHLTNSTVLYTNLGGEGVPQFDKGSLYTIFPQPTQSAVFTDVEGDGDLDYLFQPKDSNTLWSGINTGSIVNPYYAINSAPPMLAECNLGLTRISDGKLTFIKSMALTDIDGDGDLDLFFSLNLTSLPYHLRQRIGYCENQGTITSPLFSSLHLSSFGFSSEVVSEGEAKITSIFFEDRDGDGDQDLWAYPHVFDNVGSIDAPWFQKSNELFHYRKGQHFLPVDIDNDGRSDSILASNYQSENPDGTYLFYQGLAPVKNFSNGNSGRFSTQYADFINVWHSHQGVFPTQFQEMSLGSIDAMVDIAGHIHVKKFENYSGRVDKEKQGGRGHSISIVLKRLDSNITRSVITFVNDDNQVIAAVLDDDLSVVSAVQVGEGKKPHVGMGKMLDKHGYVVSYISLDNQLKTAAFLMDGTLIGRGEGGGAIDAKLSLANLVPSTADDEYVVSIIQSDGNVALLGFTVEGTLLGKVVGGSAEQPSVMSNSVSGDFSQDTTLAVSFIQADKKPVVIFLDNQGNYITKGVGERSATKVKAVKKIGVSGGMKVSLIYIDEEGVVRKERFSSTGDNQQ